MDEDGGAVDDRVFVVAGGEAAPLLVWQKRRSITLRFL